MAIGKITVTFNKADVVKRATNAVKKAIPIFTNEFIKDANYYCREDTGELERSAIRESRPNDGMAIWDTPYAKKVYYTGFPSKDKNPNASLMWAEKAARENRRKYMEMLQKVINQEV